MNPILGWKPFFALSLLTAIAAVSAPAQTFTTLTNFNGTYGEYPQGSLVQRADGNFYGAAYEGTFKKSGSVYEVTTNGQLILQHYFCSRTGCTDGSYPQGGMIAGSNGDYYGTTSLGGANDAGTVFEITEGGTVFTLHSFDGTDGSTPYAGVIQGTDGNFYGTAPNGGGGYGTVFKMTPDGTLTVLHSFIGTDGATPFGGLVQGSDGNFYGTTTNGGDYTDCGDGCGTVFKITPAGTLSTLHMFNKADGFNPYDALVQASNGNFYGTTFGGGTSSNCLIGCGTVFEITPGGALTTWHSFDGTDGGNPFAPLIQATDGNLYGTTSGNSVNVGAFLGTVFEITTSGTFTNLHSFEGSDGEYPSAALLQATDGNLYGTAVNGGSEFCSPSCGTVFKISTGFEPFVITVPNSGKVGREVWIDGTDLKGATSVTFNGVPATFKVALRTQIQTAVPAGATTGVVQVVTPSGTLMSNISFQVP